SPSLPDALPIFELHLQQRAAEGLEDLPGQIAQLLVRGLAEEDIQREGVRHPRLVPPQALVQQFVQVLGVEAVDRLAGEIVDGAYRRDDPMAARLRQQRAVIAQRQVLVALAEVDDLGAGGSSAAFAEQIVLDRDDVGAGVVRLPVLCVLDDDLDATHAAYVAY